MRIIKTDTIESIVARHKKMANAVRAAAGGLGLKLFAPNAASDAVTAIKLPENVKGSELVKTMRDKYGVSITAGQGKVKDKICRIATMGYMNEFDVMLTISCLEIALKEKGYKFQPGAGVKAAQEVLMNG